MKDIASNYNIKSLPITNMYIDKQNVMAAS